MEKHSSHTLYQLLTLNIILEMQQVYAAMTKKMGDYDLTAKKFMMHKVCYNNYVRVIDLNLKKSHNNGDYNAVKQLIEEVIIGCNKAVSMIVIYERFHPPGKYNPDHAKKYRS